MSFSSEVKTEIKNKYFTSRNRHSKMTECRQMLTEKEYLMDLFLRKGTMSDPEKFYHLEYVCDSEEEAESVRSRMQGFGIAGSVMKRREHFVVYIKDSAAISDMLALLGAHSAMLEFENVRVLKEMRENVQRRVNCETANILKTVSASMKQVEDIQLLEKSGELSKLPEPLRKTAKLRMENPDATLNELCEIMPELGKSCINHRLRRLGQLAEKLRKEQDTVCI